MPGMITIRIEDIQRDLPSYLRRVEVGETVVVLRADPPVAEIKSIASDAMDSHFRRNDCTDFNAAVKKFQAVEKMSKS